MSTKEKAVRLIRQLEAKLQGLLGEAANAADYDGVQLVTSLARSAAELAAKVEQGEAPVAESQPSRGQGTGDCPVSPDVRTAAEPRPRPTKTKRSSQKKRTRRSRRGANREYPKFFWRGGHLVKVAHSKKTGHYSHRAPEKALWSVVRAVVGLGAGGKLFTAEAMMETEGADGSEVPTYQAYLVLGWLKHEALIEPEGRQGYRVTTEGPLEGAARKKLAALPG